RFAGLVDGALVQTQGVARHPADTLAKLGGRFLQRLRCDGKQRQPELDSLASVHAFPREDQELGPGRPDEGGELRTTRMAEPTFGQAEFRIRCGENEVALSNEAQAGAK